MMKRYATAALWVLIGLCAATAVSQYTQEQLFRYRECMERTDIQEIVALLEYHRNVERIDARLYGLPRDDFDDQQGLSIDERLFLRSYFESLGTPLPTEGQIQYPREIRHFLREYQEKNGLRPDCSGILVSVDGSEGLSVLQEDTGEVKLEEDGNPDNEVNIVVNPNDPRYLVATSNDYDGGSGNDLYRSSDWGKSWVQGDVPHGSGTCDPVSYYSRDGGTDIVYHSYLTYSSAEMKYSTDNGATWNSCGRVAGNGPDRQDIAVDTDPDSGCFGNIYVAWQSGEQRVSRSTGGSFPYCQTWSSPYVTSTGGGTIGSAIVVSPTFGQPVGTDSTVHNFFTGYGTAGVYESRSTDCGSTWNTSKRWNLNSSTFEWGIPSTCTRKVYYYAQADSDRQPQSIYRNNVYVVWNDLSSGCNPSCSSSTTCNNDIFFGRGVPDDRDNPTGWAFDPKINLTAPGGPVPSDAYTDEFYPSLTVDQADGAIYVSFYRSGSGASGIVPRKTEVHYYVARSIDGGDTWEVYRVTDQPTDESGSGADTSMQWGDYTWNDVIEGVVFPAWTDRREGGDEDIWSAKVCTEPAHWSERGPAFQPPAVDATPAGVKTIDITWTPPDLYWGDAGENPSSRKYQLWVDGSLDTDTIPWTDSSASYTASDCTTSHTFVIRAINQCGVFKDYQAATATATGCCSANPTVDVAPDGPIDVCGGASQILTASLTGGVGPFSYQWTRDGVDIPGANGPSYDAANTGTHGYNCKVKSASCTEWTKDLAPTSLAWESSPSFVGLSSVSTPGLATCVLDLTFPPASTACPGPLTYRVYRSTTPGFIPSVVTRIYDGPVTCPGGTCTYSDGDTLTDGVTYHYVVRAFEASSGSEDGNLVRGSGAPTGPSTLGPFTEDFEANDPSWVGTGLWHRVQPSSCVAPPATSGTGAWYYGQDATCDFKTTNRTTGTLTSPAIANVTATSTLDFSYWREVESARSGRDQTFVEVSYNGGSSWAQVWYLDSSTASAPGWTSAGPIPLSPPSPPQDILVRFTFDSRDKRRNSFIGWLIDDLTISDTGTVAACTTQAPLSLPPVGDGAVAGGTPALFTWDGAAVTATWDVGTCSGSDAVILYGTLGLFGTYTGAAACSDALGDGSETFAPPGGNLWFNILFIDGSTAGHPGFSSGGVRLLSASPWCAISGDDASDPLCN